MTLTLSKLSFTVLINSPVSKQRFFDCIFDWLPPSHAFPIYTVDVSGNTRLEIEVFFVISLLVFVECSDNAF